MNHDPINRAKVKLSRESSYVRQSHTEDRETMWPKPLEFFQLSCIQMVIPITSSIQSNVPLSFPISLEYFIGTHWYCFSNVTKLTHRLKRQSKHGSVWSKNVYLVKSTTNMYLQIDSKHPYIYIYIYIYNAMNVLLDITAILEERLIETSIADISWLCNGNYIEQGQFVNVPLYSHQITRNINSSKVCKALHNNTFLRFAKRLRTRQIISYWMYV